jgi:hypothetical protein
VTRGRLDRIEDLEPVRPDGPALSASARISGGSARWRLSVAAVAMFLVVALVKPWGATAPPTGSRVPDSSQPERQLIAAAARDDDLADLRSNCDEPFGWRVYSREGPITGMPFRVWSSVTPATSATGPTDPALPLVQVAPTIEALGYCAPWRGPDAPPEGVEVAAWELEPGARPVDAPTARPLTLVPVAPARPSQFTGLYHEHDASRPGASHGPDETWPHGHYVFRVSADTWARWWAVEVSLPWASPGPSAAAPPSRPAPSTNHGSEEGG